MRIVLFILFVLYHSNEIGACNEEEEEIVYIDPRRDAFGMGKKINVRVNERELENLTTDFSSIYEHAIEACKIRERIDDDDVEQILQKQIPESQMEKCFVACWLEQFQVIHNGEFRRDQYLKLISVDGINEMRKKQLQEILNDCKRVDACKPKRCELAYRIVKCVFDGAVKRKLNPNDF